MTKKKRRKSFFEMTDAERDLYVARFDKEIDLPQSKPLTLKQQVLHIKAMQKGSRKRILPIAIDSTLLRRASRLAETRGITLDQLFEQGVRKLFTRSS